jgi:hypothetical protein
MKNFNFHPQLRIRCGNFDDLVDKELAPLILDLWQADLVTLSCCQDAGESLHDLPERLPHMAAWVAFNQGRAYIDFRYLAHVCAFLTIVANGGPRDELYERITNWRAPGAWTVLGVQFDLGDESDEDLAKDGDRLSYFDFLGWQVKFPRTDIPAITKRFRRFRPQGRVEVDVPTWQSIVDCCRVSAVSG